MTKNQKLSSDFLSLAPGDLRDAFSNAALEKKISPVIMEKDFWSAVCSKGCSAILKSNLTWSSREVPPYPRFTMSSIGFPRMWRKYIESFSESVRDIFEHFEFHTQLDRLHKAGLLHLVTEKFAKVDLHPKAVDNHQMGLIFEELIRKFAELSNETAGEHFTPREVIRLMVSLLFIEDDEALSKSGAVRAIYDPTAGTGGMLSIAGEYLAEHNSKARLSVFGQELNPESYAICKADMLIKGQEVSQIVFGNTLSEDGHPGQRFDYMLSNPPFGVEWKKVEKEVRKEHEEKGFDGRFGPGLPRVSDGSLLFLLHLHGHPGFGFGEGSAGTARHPIGARAPLGGPARKRPGRLKNPPRRPRHEPSGTVGYPKSGTVQGFSADCYYEDHFPRMKPACSVRYPCA
jgi:hypothetical protein